MSISALVAYMLSVQFAKAGRTYHRIHSATKSSVVCQGVRFVSASSCHCSVWHGRTRDMTILFICHHATGEITVNQHTKQDEVHVVLELPVPPAVVDYNLCMGGLDKSVQYATYYTIKRKTWKWWKVIFPVCWHLHHQPMDTAFADGQQPTWSASISAAVSTRPDQRLE